jgi:putative ABC transport system substrate-binding protein
VLQQLGWTEGRNIEIDYRWAHGKLELMQRHAKELVALKPDLIFTNNTPTTTAVLQQTRTIPIIFASVSDPVGSGFVAAFASRRYWIERRTACRQQCHPDPSNAEVSQ